VAISVVQSVGLGTWTGNFGSNVTTGSTLIYVTSAYNTTGATISSSSPVYNSATPSGSTELATVWSGGTDSAYTAIWMLPNVTGGASSIGITMTNQSTPGDTHTVGLAAYEIAGLGTSPSLDKSSTSSGNSTAVTSGASGAITTTPEIVIGGLVIFGQVMALVTSPWTSIQLSDQFQQSGYQIVTSGSSSYTYAQTAGGSAEWVGAVVTVKGTAAASHLPFLYGIV
jgi:hypothetical protein